MEDTTANPLPSSDQLKRIVEQANGGDQAALALLRELLDGHPEIWQRVGDMARHAELLLIQLIAGEDKLMGESLQRKLAELKAQLGGSNPSPFEKLAIERVVATWLQLQHIDALVAKAIPGSKPANYLLKRQGQTDRAYNTALKALATIRRLLPSDAEPHAHAGDQTSQAGAAEAAVLLSLDAGQRRRA